MVIKYAFLTRPKIGEHENGDLVGVISGDSSYLFYVIDVLGHGSEARKVALELDKIIGKNWERSLEDIIWTCHDGILGSRGAALFLSRFYLRGSRKAEFSGIGNIEIKAICKNIKSLPFSYDGTVGIRIRRVNTFSFDYDTNEIYCLFTDGISSRFNLEEVNNCEPKKGVEIIMQKYSKEHDDASVLLIKT